MRTLLSCIFIVAGVLHFVVTPTYVSIMPGYLPHPVLLVQISGICEVLGGLGLLLPDTRAFAAWGLIALLVCVMPANLNMALHASDWPRIPVWALWMRLPLQLPFIWWAGRYIKPFKKKHVRPFQR